MYNINSPIVQELLKNTPSGGMGNMQFYNGPAPRLEMAPMPSPSGGMINVSPYPDPYNMITGIGMQNYAMPYNAPIMGSGVTQGIYRDINQPIQGGLPIQGYYNPYMGIGTSFGTGPSYFPSQYVSPEDMAAKMEGFANAAEKMVNDFNISKMISKAAYIGAGLDKETINKIMEAKDKQFSKDIDNFRENQNNRGYNPISLNGYISNNRSQKPTFKTVIKRGDTIIAEYDPNKNNNVYINPNRVDAIMTGLEMSRREREMKDAYMAQMHATAVERELDHEDSIDFFNHGINIVHHRDKEIEYDKIMRNSKRLYDSDKFKQQLIENHGSPQDKLRYAREKQRKEKREAERRREDNEKGLIRGDECGTLFKDFSPEVSSAFRVGENGITITVPDFIKDSKPIVKGTSIEKEYDEKMKDINNKIDEFLEDYSPSMITNTPALQPQGMSTLTGYAPNNNFMSHYQACREKFMREVNNL